MRMYQKIETVLSEDEGNAPKKILFQDTREFTEVLATPGIIVDGGGRTETIPASTVDYSIPLGNMSAGKWFYFCGDLDFSLKIDGGAALNILAGKPSSMFVDFTTLEVTTGAGGPLRLTWAIGGD